MVIFLNACASSDPFEDPTIETHLISHKTIQNVKSELKSGYLVKGKLIDKTNFCLEVKLIDKDGIHGTRGEKIDYDKLDYLDYITPDDFSLLSRAPRCVLAALAAVVFFIAGLAESLFH
jgi:hypothetical protein